MTAEKLEHNNESVASETDSREIREEQIEPLQLSSSRIQESYFDDEMQARISRSSRRRKR